ncbi:hypothetical protein PQ459_13870 [Chryseobacterium sp. KACC 21268]|nr:hypothetical protein PQ459_13870 [Chryseobacterium sp. KACC 21268]
MKNYLNTYILIVSYFFILLFVYASISKILDFENFQVQIAQSPVLNTYAGFVSYAVIISELTIVFLLLFRKSRLLGLYLSLSIMFAFTIYIYLILNFSESIPCSCGGVLEKMDWTDHMIFNLVCILLVIIAIVGSEKKDQKTLVGFISLAAALPAILLSLIFYPHINDDQGSFTRKIMVPLTAEQKVIKLPTDNYYFAGNQGDTLFLGNRKTPLLLSGIDPDFNNVKVDTIKLDNYHHQFVSVTINVLYPYFSVSDGKVPVIFEGKLPSLKAYDTGIDRLYFSRFYMLGPKHYVFRTMLVKTKENELGILNTDSKQYLLFPNVLQTQVDGVFDTDGDISIDRQNKLIVYTHLYRSEMIKADFGLQNIQRRPTIDSSSRTLLETKTLKSGQTKLIRSPNVINRAQTISGNRFYNISKIRGQDESFTDFRNKNVVDVYDASTQKYLYSFYIKNERRIKIKGILCTKKYFYVLAGNQMTRYAFK